MEKSRSIISFVGKYALLGLLISVVIIFMHSSLRLDYSGKVDFLTGQKSTVSYANAINLARPAVVRILVTEHTPTRSRSNRAGQVSLDGGSGIIYDDSGYVLTSYHILDQAIEIFVQLLDGRLVEAKLVGKDALTDIAVLKIDLPDLPTILLNPNRETRVGDIVFAIGHPFINEQTATMGIVSSTNKKRVGLASSESFIQTDAAINVGNSGGALINAHGELVGLIAGIAGNRNISFEGIGFAVPTTLLDYIFSNIIEHGRVIRGWLGVTAFPSPSRSICKIRNNQALYVRVARIYSEGPSVAAGIRFRDIISEVNGVAITDTPQISQMISHMQPGSTVKVSIVRELINQGGETKCEGLELDVKIIEKPQG